MHVKNKLKKTLSVPVIAAFITAGMLTPGALASTAPNELADTPGQSDSQLSDSTPADPGNVGTVDEGAATEPGEASDGDALGSSASTPSSDIGSSLTLDEPQSGSSTPEDFDFSIEFPSGLTRLAGVNRYETSARIAELYPTGVKAAFVATGSAFPDALSAASAAAKSKAPLLLTTPTALPASTKSQLERLQPEVIYVLGGTGAVNDSVADQLRRIAPVERIGASDRYSTSLAISRSAFDSASFAVIATGSTFPDALAASGVAGSLSGPVLLVNGAKSSVPVGVIQELRRLGVSDVMIAGGTGAVSAGIASQISAQGFQVQRLGGSDRYATAAAINGAYFPAGSSNHVFLATGTDFPDALGGAAVAGLLGAPLFTTSPSCMPASVKKGVENLGADSRVVFGGTGAVSNAAANGTVCVAAKPTPKPPVTKPPTTTPTGPPAGARIVTAGAYCKKVEQGQIGYTSAGTKMKCTLYSGEKTPRWRKA